MDHLWRARGVRSYFLAATSARTGDEMVAVALVILVLDRTGSAPLAGAIVGSYLVPTVLSGPLLGAWLDRTRFRRAALAANQIALAIIMLALLATVGTADAWVALALAATVGITVPMTSGGFTSLLPRFVPPERLGRAHAVEGVSFNVAAILGPAAAATLAAALSPSIAVATIAGIAVVSVIAIAGIPRAVGTTATPLPISLASAIRAGVRHIVVTPQLRGVTLATSIGFVGFGMLTVTLPLHTMTLTGSAAYGGYVFAAFEVGAILTALAWGRWHMRWRPERAVLCSLLATGVVILAWPAAGVFGALLALAFAAGLGSGAGLPALFTTRQRYTPPGLYSQISTTGASVKLGSFAVGSTLGGTLAATLSTAPLFAVVAALYIGGAVVGALAMSGIRGPGPPTRSPRPATGWLKSGTPVCKLPVGPHRER